MRIRREYFWPLMCKHAREYISSCDTCKQVKSPNFSLKPPMGEAFSTSRPFQRIYCDFLGPYPRTKSQNTTLFIDLDHLTKYILLEPINAATSTNIIRLFQNNIFPAFGVPQFLHSDNGRQFISKDFQDFLSKYDILHIKTVLYSPQANASERSNQEIISKIRIFMKGDDHHQNWDSFIPHILSVLRSDFHSVIGCSPYYAVMGQNMIQHASEYQILEKLGCLQDDFVVRTNADKLCGIRDKIRENLEKSKTTYDTRSRTVNFREGQEVHVRNFRQSDFSKALNAKFLPRFKSN